MKTTPYHVEWSPDGKKLLFGTKEFNLFVLDIMTKKMTLVASSRQLKNDEFYWEVSDYTWSPDSRWIAYSTVQFNRNNQIFLYSLETGKSTPVTTDFYDSLNPSFDKNGECLYFLSYRNFETQLDLFEDNHVIPNPVQVMALQLRKGEKAFTPDSAKKPFRIDLEGLNDRIFPLPVPAGNYFYLKAGKGTVTWASVPSYLDGEQEELFKPKGREKWDLHIYDSASQRESVLSKIADWGFRRRRTSGQEEKSATPTWALRRRNLAPPRPGKLRYTVVPRESEANLQHLALVPGTSTIADYGSDWEGHRRQFRQSLLTSLRPQLAPLPDGRRLSSPTPTSGGDFAPPSGSTTSTSRTPGAETPTLQYYRFKALRSPVPGTSRHLISGIELKGDYQSYRRTPSRPPMTLLLPPGRQGRRWWSRQLEAIALGQVYTVEPLKTIRAPLRALDRRQHRQGSQGQRRPHQLYITAMSGTSPFDK